jgi:hypothetical protein
MFPSDRRSHYHRGMWRLLLVACIAGPTFYGISAQQQNMTSQLDTRPRTLDCGRLDWMKDGRPVFVDSGDGVRVGISTSKSVVAEGERVIVDIWVDNQSDKPVLSGGRCPPYLHHGDVFDSSGRRLVGAQEQERLDAQKKGGDTVSVCASTEILVEIPPHSCKAPVDAHGDNFALGYVLRPGVYYVFPGRGTDPKLFTRGLKITVRPQ